MMNYWLEIDKLKGKTLRTLDRGNPFDGVAVTDSDVIVQPHVRDMERKISRKEIEGAFRELSTRRELTRVKIHEQYSEFNTAYVAAILAALPGVEHKIRPIRLYYQSKSRNVTVSRPKSQVQSSTDNDSTVKATNKAAVQLLREWLDDESGYDESVWPTVKEAIEQNHLSVRARFSD
jgi:hypothetical protein